MHMHSHTVNGADLIDGTWTPSLCCVCAHTCNIPVCVWGSIFVFQNHIGPAPSLCAGVCRHTVCDVSCVPYMHVHMCACVCCHHSAVGSEGGAENRQSGRDYPGSHRSSIIFIFLIIPVSTTSPSATATVESLPRGLAGVCHVIALHFSKATLILCVKRVKTGSHENTRRAGELKGVDPRVCGRGVKVAFSVNTLLPLNGSFSV